jgi:predicted glycogen debranching enzyme
VPPPRRPHGPDARADHRAAPSVAAASERRKALGTPLRRAADAYIVRRGEGRTIIAGYPWFTDWGRDTFIALRGFMTLPGGLDLGRKILLAWAPTVSEGMVPNRFPEAGEQPEYNAVDASLWYVIAAHEYLSAGQTVPDADVERLHGAIDRIIAGYRTGTRFGIHMAEDGLIAAGVPGAQLTWMDAKVGDWVVTPRIGKPVEIQALWINVLRIAGTRTPALNDLADEALAAFRARFWHGGRLFDVVDVDHVSGKDDATMRPNQIFAAGGLPVMLLEPAEAGQVVEAVERLLLTPMGLRSLAPDAPGYQGHYAGGVRERDGAYHQGTAWPWLLGPFVEAWLRQRGFSAAARREADTRFLAPLRDHLEVAGIGHVSEIADGAPPHTPRGCPFQAWSLAELLRLNRMIEESPS